MDLALNSKGLIKREYERLKRDPNYTDVAFNPANGGLKATHREHSFDPSPSPFGINMQRGDYEKNAANVLYRYGKKVILQSELSENNVKVADGFLNDVKFDIKGVESTSLKSMIHRFADTSKKEAEIIVLYYPKKSLFDIETIKNTYTHYLRNSKSKRINTVYYIIDDKLRML